MLRYPTKSLTIINLRRPSLTIATIGALCYDPIMAAPILEQPNLSYLLKALANFVKLPAKKMWLDYDDEVDVLYVHFEEKPTSTHSEMTDEGIILDYQNDVLVGLTILEASQREM